MYAPARDFIWLIETGEGWQRTQVLNRWPVWEGSGRASLDGHHFQKLSEYGARVAFACGSFNWRVSVGDVVRVTEFADGGLRLAAEATSEELTWSRSTPLALDQVRAWFGEHVHVDQTPHPKYMGMARQIVITLAVINSIPLLLATGSVLPYALLAVAAIYLPAYFLDRLDERTQ
jgi:hypothetical protein